MHQIDRFNQGVLACVFDTLDRIQHMFFRDRMDIIEQWYEDLDKLIGRDVYKRQAYRSLLHPSPVAVLLGVAQSLGRWLPA